MHRCIVATWYMLSSLLWPREEAAVAEWLDSGLPFHVMRWDQLELALSYHFATLSSAWYCRDNPYHYTAILGGMWGARMDTGMKNTLDTSFRQLMNSVRIIQLLNSSTHAACLTIYTCPQTARSKHWHKGLDQTMLTQWVWPQVTGSYTVLPC